MKSMWWKQCLGIAAFAAGLLAGCSDTQQPAMTTVGDAALTADNVITQDLSQLSSVGIPPSAVYGVFSVGWNQFVGPAIQPVSMIGKAFVVVHVDTPQAGVRPSSIDIGSVTLAYSGGSVGLTQRTAPNGNVIYSTFDRGLRDPQSIPVNVPFVGGGTYAFSVSGSAAFPAGTFSITAPSSLLDIANVTGDSISINSDVTIAWTGGEVGESVVVRAVPHLAPRQLQQPMGGGRGPRGPQGGPGGMGSGQHQGPGSHQGPGFGVPPLPPKSIVKVVPNTGTLTFTAEELQDLISGSSASEIMFHVAQVGEEVVEHDGKPYALLLKNADRVILKLR